MALHATNTSVTRPSFACLSLLHLTLLLVCWLLVVQGAESTPKATPLKRRHRAAGCSQSCAQSTEMRRCLRLACRKYALGSLTRFGKRDGAGTDAQLDEDGTSSDINLIPSAALSPFEREDILQKLLSRERSQTVGLGSPYAGEEKAGGNEGELELEPGAADDETLTHPLNLDDFDQITRRSSQYPLLQPLALAQSRDTDHQKATNHKLLRWLLQASRDLRRERLRLLTQSSDDDVIGRLDPTLSLDNTRQHQLTDPTEDLRMRRGNLWDPETAQTNRMSTFSYSLSPFTYQDLSKMLRKRTSSSSPQEQPAYSFAFPGQKMRRYQRGLLKHLIRFG